MMMAVWLWLWLMGQDTYQNCKTDDSFDHDSDGFDFNSC